MTTLEIHSAFALAKDVFSKRAEPFAGSGLAADAAAEVAYLIQELNLPVPDGRSYVSGNDGALLFLENFGVVVRIENNAVRLDDDVSSNPFVLQPLGRIKGRHVTVEICAGARPSRSEQNIFWLQDRLAESNLELDDNDLDARNCVLLPYPHENWPHGVPVICDRPAVVRTGRYQAPGGGTAEEFALIQEELYGELQHAFSKAWRPRDFAADPGFMAAFWEECRDKAKEGTLIAGWNDSGKGEKRHLHQANAASASSYYQELLAANPPDEAHFEREHKNQESFRPQAF